MNKIIIALLMIFSVLTVACTPTINDGTGDNEPKVCTEDAKLCADGSAVGRDGNNNCEFFPCPDDSGKTYIETDLEQCALIKYMCAEGKQPFTDENGCGCEPVPVVDGKLKAYDCTDPRPTACTKEYMPVCGQVQIQCITTPCDPIKETFSNKCEACANSLTISYTEGACTDDSAAGGTVPAYSGDYGCADIGGSYDPEFKECIGVTQEQCQEIGGTFNECASACRNNPDAQVCTLQCVQVCKLN